VRVERSAKKLIVSDKRRYLEKMADVESDPYCIPTAELSKEVIPSVQSTDIFTYLALNTSFCTSQMFKAFKSLDAYKKSKPHSSKWYCPDYRKIPQFS